jgi:predicted ATP-dependent endonuclease of OLD family
MIKSVAIEHYKGFYDVEKIYFAKPDGTNFGSGLTLIVGPNNTGKTSVIEALLLNKDKKFKNTERHNNLSPVIKIENVSGKETKYTNINDGAIITTSGEEHGIIFELIPSRRYWQHQFSGEWKFDNLIHESAAGDIRNSGSFNLGPILRKILREPSLKSKFDLNIKNVLPHFTDWTIDTNEANQDFIKYKTNDDWHQASLLGDGVISLFRIMAHLVHDKNSTFIIDEPELSLHPAAQKRLSNVLSQLSKDKQIIICTHSPYFVNWGDFCNGAKIVRLNKPSGKCKVNILDNNKNYSDFISTSLQQFEKPQLLDTTAKEILFSDKILFTEGQEDVGIIKKWCFENKRNLSFEIFGYGVGGETNMALFLELATDLGLEKVGAIYDSNSTKFQSDKTTYGKFSLKQLPTEDIRDKTNRCSAKCPYGKNRDGTFSSDGHLKQEHKKAFEDLFDEMCQYFDSPA